MKILDILQEIEKVDVNTDNVNDRRDTLKSLFNFGKKVSLTSIPLALGNLFQKTNAQTTSSDPIIDVLNFLVVFEQLQYNFYNNGLVTSTNLIPVADKPLFTKLRDQEKAHIDHLNTLITTLGGTPRATIAPEAFEYRRGVETVATNGTITTTYTFGTNIFTNYQNFLTAGMLLEDFTVRAYKGQFTILQTNKAILASALRIHTVQARHAAQVREVLRDLQGVNFKQLRPWVSARRLDAGGLSLSTAGDIQVNDTFLNAASALYDVDSTTINRETKTSQAGYETSSFSHFQGTKVEFVNGKEVVTINPAQILEDRAIASAAFDEYFLITTAKIQLNWYLKPGFRIA